MKKTFLLLILLFFFSLKNMAQRLSDHNNIIWLTTTLTPKISDKFSGHIEYQWRRADWLKNWQQSVLRLGVNYKIHPQVTAQVGYGYIKTYAYGTYTPAALPNTFDEHRIYEQLTISAPIGKVNISNRLRLEQRWFGRYLELNSNTPDSWVYLNRIRYMPRIDMPVSKKIYAAVYDEIFIGFGGNIGQNVFDQNRVGILAGYKANNTFKLEVGYINQTLQLARKIEDKNVFQYNNGIVINTFFNF